MLYRTLVRAVHCVGLLGPIGACGATTWADDVTQRSGEQDGSGIGGARAPLIPYSSEESSNGPVGEGGNGGGGDGAPDGHDEPPYGTSMRCGDGIVGAEEQCDDGPGAAPDACNEECQVRDQLADSGFQVAKSLGRGRHPVAGIESGFLAAYTSVGGDFIVRANIFDIWGRPQRNVLVSEGAAPIDRPEPVVAALPDGGYVVAWTDLLGDGLDVGIAMRRVEANGSLGMLSSPTPSAPFPQNAADIIWTGRQLAVAWVDYSDPEQGADVRYRLFDEDLYPLSSELVLADSEASETNVALARFGDSFAAAYRESDGSGRESVVVVADDTRFRVGPFLSSGVPETPALVALDSRHLLVVFSCLATEAESAWLGYSVVDVTSDGARSPQILPVVSPALEGDEVSLHEPVADSGPAGAYLAWTSKAHVANGPAEQVWLKHLTWDVEGAAIDFNEIEMPVTSACRGNEGSKSNPVLARTNLPPLGGLALAWDDDTRALGSPVAPESVLRFAPMQSFRELTSTCEK